MTTQASGWKSILHGATPGVEGAYVEMIASTSFASTWMKVVLEDLEANAEAEFDIATGGAGSEVEIITDQHIHQRNIGGGTGRGNWFTFPMTIPSGTRLSMRIKGTEALARTYEGALNISNFTPSPAIPNVSQSSGFKTVTSGGLGGAYGSFVELVSSLNNSAVWMFLTLYSQTSGQLAEFDIGIGSGGNEVEIVEDIPFQKTLTGGNTASMCAYFPIVIAAGNRVSIRVKDPSPTMFPYQVGAVFF